MKTRITLFALLVNICVNAQEVIQSEITKAVLHDLDLINKVKADQEKNTIKKLWYQGVSIRGYALVSYIGLLSTNDKVPCDLCHKYCGTTSTAPDTKVNDGFFIRLARIIFSGLVHPKCVFLYSARFR
ncbi:hypothetical protein [Flavobacterium sp.]|uniref:hypothetical protein n=1 Tax=Flavobacterium sp. TaxID=239 RepID=UPI003753A379